jgi:hypothetical protein
MAIRMFNRLRALKLLSSGVAALALPAAAIAAPVCKVSAVTQASGIAAAPTGSGVELRWRGQGGDALVLNLAIDGAAPKIAALSVNGAQVVSDAEIWFDIKSGMRRITNQQLEPLRKLGVPITQEEVDEHKWDAFWDAPFNVASPNPRARMEISNQPPAEGILGQKGLPRTEDEIVSQPTRYALTACTVQSDGARATVTLPGVTAGVFTGALRLTVYRDTNLIRAELVAKTDQPSVAYKYDAGLSGIATGVGGTVHWQDSAGVGQRMDLSGKANESNVALRAANRIVVAQSDGGAVAAFPPPHTFFWAREIEANVGNNWYRKEAGDRLSIGIRQADEELVEDYKANWSLYSAPPGSEQHMALYLYPVAGAAAAAREGALSFTRGDRYGALPGYKVFAHHYHLGMGERLLKSGSVDTHMRDFDALRGAGVDIVGVADIFPAQRNPGGPKRLEVLKAYYEGAARASSRDFLVLPTVEAVNILGGHWDVLMPRPTLWLEERAKEEAFKTTEADGSTVYRLGGADDAMKMIEEAGMVVFMPHPRTKGSTHYPDAIADSPAFNKEFYRGVGWRWGMGADLSEKRLSEKRVLPVLDDINNWMAAKGLAPKYILSITETFEKEPGDDIYGNTPVSYLKLDSLPTGQDYSPVIDVLKRGDFFVTSGEVLIPEAKIEREGKGWRYVADLHWTFPLDIIEVVWGDGKKTYRKIVDARSMPALGQEQVTVSFDGRGAKWARFAVWDSAGNGAMTQPQKMP